MGCANSHGLYKYVPCVILKYYRLVPFAGSLQPFRLKENDVCDEGLVHTAMSFCDYYMYM